MRCTCGKRFTRSEYANCPGCGRRVPPRVINTGGGAYIEGNITVGGDVCFNKTVIVKVEK